MNILALDLGTKCGYASSYGASGVLNLKPTTHESAGERYRKFKDWLFVTLQASFDLVVYEEVHAHIGVEAAHVYGGLVAVLQTACLETNTEYKGVGVQTIKKHATGNGNAKKDDMVITATLKFPKVNVIDDNHADALHLLDYAISSLHLQNEL
jgi:Holliday junction resolvasome RuvABC endonuclease subunit